MDLSRISKSFSPTDNIDIMVDYISQSLVSFYENHRTSIENYDKWMENQEKIQYLSNPVYKIYELKNRKSVNTLVANVKWKFLYNGKFFYDGSEAIFDRECLRSELKKLDKNSLR